MLDRLAALREARRALSDGDPEKALERLEGQAVQGAKSADRLRKRTLDALAREAQRRLRRGEAEPARELLDELARRDPELAARVGQEALATAGPGALEAPLDPVELPSAESASADGASVAPAFHLAVDEGGELYTHTGERLVVGHAHSPGADLPVLADIGPSHALLERRASLRAGPRWFVVPLSRERMRLGSKPVPEEGCELVEGELLSLAPNCALRLSLPDPASSSAVLELLLGAECAGAPRVLLLAGGVAGRVRFGPGPHSHVRVGALSEDVSLVLAGSELVLASGAGLSVDGEPAQPTVELPCPPQRRRWVAVGGRAEGEPPLAIGLAPSTRATESGGG